MHFYVNYVIYEIGITVIFKDKETEAQRSYRI